MSEVQFEAAQPRQLAGLGAIMVPVFTATLFLSAFLLFSVQPYFTKIVLPKLGGSPGVWSVAMVFFQSMLLLGYGYAHLLIRYFSSRNSSLIHLGVMLVAFIALPIAIPENWSDVPNSGQVPWLIGLFTVTVGLPFFAVSANGPLLQAWFSRTDHPYAKDPYFLYAASNIGSFASLFLYILFFEPLFAVKTQSLLWSGGFGILAIGIAFCAMFVLRSRANYEINRNISEFAATKPTTKDRLSWIGLAAIPSALLVAVTSFVSTDVASAPFLWVIPLALFLATFVIVFAKRQIVSPVLLEKLLIPAILVGLITLFQQIQVPGWLNILFHYSLFFLVALVAHGAMAAKRPAASHLTEFYFLMSVGGLIGGVFTSLVAPVIFVKIAEYPLLLIISLFASKEVARIGFRSGVMVVALALSMIFVLDGSWREFIPNSKAVLVLILCLILVNLAVFQVMKERAYQQGGLMLALTFLVFLNFQIEHPLFKERSFFGVTTVLDSEELGIRILQHGTTVHGAVRLGSGDGGLDSPRPEPLTYYHFDSGMARSIAAMRERRNGIIENVGVVGLGSGSLACYKQSGENWDFYEIDQLMIDLAKRKDVFGFVPNCAPDSRMIVGDARLTLGKEPAGKYDLLIIDAFSSDSIPVHLLTVEAMKLYRSKMKEDGLLVMHISNRHMNLAPVLAANAEELGLQARVGSVTGDNYPPQTKKLKSLVAFISRNDVELGSLSQDKNLELTKANGFTAWTDDYSNILAAMMLQKQED